MAGTVGLLGLGHVVRSNIVLLAGWGVESLKFKVERRVMGWQKQRCRAREPDSSFGRGAENKGFG
jgi:hypothetical protein